MKRPTLIIKRQGIAVDQADVDANNGKFIKAHDGQLVFDESGGGAIPEYDADPSSPAAEDVWVLKGGSPAVADGVPIGLLLALTYTDNPGTGYTYQLSYRTALGTTVRATLA